MARQRKHKIHKAFKRQDADNFHPPSALRHAAVDYQPPAALRRIRRGLAGIAFFVAVVMAYAIYWMATAYVLNNKVNDWLADRRAEGYHAVFEDYQFSGFPLLFRMEFIKPSIAAAGENPTWSWRNDRAVAESLPWRPWNLKVRALGEHHLDLAMASEKAAYAGSTGELSVEFHVGDEWPPSGRLTIRDLDISAGLALRASARNITAVIDNLGNNDAASHAPTARFALDAHEVTMPPAFFLPAGNNISRLSLEAQLLGYIAPGPMPASLARWRDAGGALEIRRFNVVYGPLNLLMGGALAVDEQVQPIGAFTAKAQGFFEVIDGLRKAGLVSGKDALTATLVLGAMARKPKNGGPMSLNLVIAIQNRKIYAGSVFLAEIPAIPWKESIPDGKTQNRSD